MGPDHLVDHAQDAAVLFDGRLGVHLRDARRIEIAGAVEDASSADELEARLDAILDAASGESYEAELRLRPGRRLLVRRANMAGGEDNISVIVGQVEAT